MARRGGELRSLVTVACGISQGLFYCRTDNECLASRSTSEIHLPLSTRWLLRSWMLFPSPIPSAIPAAVASAAALLRRPHLYRCRYVKILSC